MSEYTKERQPPPEAAEVSKPWQIKRSDILKTFNTRASQVIEDTPENRAALEYVYTQGKERQKVNTRPIYEHAAQLYGSLEGAAEATARKMKQRNPRLLVVVMMVHICESQHYKNKGNLHRFATFGMIKELTNMGTIRLHRRLNNAVKQGYLEEVKQEELKDKAKQRKDRPIKFYKTTQEGKRLVKLFARIFAKQHNAMMSKEATAAIILHNYNVKFLTHMAIKFNAKRESFNYDHPMAAKLNLLIPDYKNRFKK